MSSDNADRACLTDSWLILISFRGGGDSYYPYTEVRDHGVCLSLLEGGVLLTTEQEHGEEQMGSGKQITEPLPPWGLTEKVASFLPFHAGRNPFLQAQWTVHLA